MFDTNLICAAIYEDSLRHRNSPSSNGGGILAQISDSSSPDFCLSFAYMILCMGISYLFYDTYRLYRSILWFCAYLIHRIFHSRWDLLYRREVAWRRKILVAHFPFWACSHTSRSLWALRMSKRITRAKCRNRNGYAYPTRTRWSPVWAHVLSLVPG